jgi:hypothetical protein
VIVVVIVAVIVVIIIAIVVVVIATRWSGGFQAARLGSGGRNFLKACCVRAL